MTHTIHTTKHPRTVQNPASLAAASSRPHHLLSNPASCLRQAASTGKARRRLLPYLRRPYIRMYSLIPGHLKLLARVMQ